MTEKDVESELYIRKLTESVSQNVPEVILPVEQIELIERELLKISLEMLEEARTTSSWKLKQHLFNTVLNAYTKIKDTRRADMEELSSEYGMKILISFMSKLPRVFSSMKSYLTYCEVCRRLKSNPVTKETYNETLKNSGWSIDGAKFVHTDEAKIAYKRRQ